MNELQMLHYDEYIPVRYVLLDDNTWWVMRAVCLILGLECSLKTARLLDNSCMQDVMSRETFGFDAGRQRRFAVINQAGIMILMLHSASPEAVPFNQWLHNEALPTIIKQEVST